MDNWLWDRKSSEKQIREILADVQNAGFIEMAALLLSRHNNPKLIFSRYLSEENLVVSWLRIKRRMKQNKWDKKRIVFWQAIYEKIRVKLKAKGFKARQPKISPDPFLKNIGNEIRTLRLKNSLTQKALADKMQIDQRVISRIEKGRDNVSLKYLQRIAGALGADLKVYLTKN